MRNKLEYLICAIYCAVLYNNCGYSTDYNSNLNIEDEIKDVVGFQNNLTQLQQEYKTEISDIYEKYGSLKQIVSNKFTKYIDNNINDNTNIFDFLRNKYYIANAKNEYNFFIKKHTNQSKRDIEELANILLQDNLNFIHEYSYNNLQINYLFVLAWNILMKYAICNNMRDSYQTICNLMPKLGKKANINIMYVMYFFLNNNQYIFGNNDTIE